jgi:hypothetical protein
MVNKNKLFLVVLLFVFVFSVSAPLMGTSNDDGVHKEMALNFAYQQDYHSWFRFTSQYFVGYPILWLIMGFGITGAITSIILYFITKNWWTFFFYFFGSNYFLVMWGTGIYPQALTVVFGLLLVLYRKSWWKQGLVFIIGFGVHGFVIQFLALLWALLLLQEYLPKLKAWLTCSPIFGYNTPQALMTKIGSQEYGNHFELGELTSFITKMVPLPFLLVSFYEWFKQKQAWPFLLLLALFVGAIFQWNERVLWNFAPFIWIGFIPYFERSQHKKWWILLALIIGITNFYLFIRLKTGVGC